MNVLILGSGGREHALAWKLRQSARVERLFCAPGNGGIGGVAECVPLKLGEMDRLVDFAREQQIGMTVVGPDDALAAGMVDRFEAAGLRVFGPERSAARLESSKVFAKQFMQRHGIPTARFGHFSDSGEARKFAAGMRLPIVVKADGLALGKGVLIAYTEHEVEKAIAQIMDERAFGDAGNAVVLEEFLQGPECSVHALVDGTDYLLFPSAQDHKRALDGDAGLNTGGMGTYSPMVAWNPELEARVRREILEPFVRGIQTEGIRFRGMLFPGLILTADGPKVLEFNCRFGDPETQVLLTRLETDLLDLLEATVNGTLATQKPRWRPGASVCVIAASGGYPEKIQTGYPIGGLEKTAPDAVVFHAGTRREGDGIVTAGGRVLGVTACADSLGAARDAAYASLGQIHFENMHFRRDIAASALRSVSNSQP